MKSDPSVSVIIATFNRESYLKEALQSLASQTFNDFEIIVVDDGSTDKTKEIVESFPLPCRYHYQDNQGAAAAKNKGVELAQGSFIAFLDSDDLWHEEKLQRQYALLTAANNAPDLVYCHGTHFISREVEGRGRDRLHCPEGVVPALVTSGMLTSKRCFLEVGWFDESLRVGIDIDWHLRAKLKGLSIHVFPEVFYYRRIHPDNSGYLNKNHRKQHVRVVKSYIDQMRKKNKTG